MQQGCDDIEEEESTGTFSVSPLSVTLKKNSSTGATVKLIAPANWTSSFWGNAECSPTSGAKGTWNIKVNKLKNVNSEDGLVTIKCNGKTKSIRITVK